MLDGRRKNKYAQCRSLSQLLGETTFKPIVFPELMCKVRRISLPKGEFTKCLERIEGIEGIERMFRPKEKFTKCLEGIEWQIGSNCQEEKANQQEKVKDKTHQNN